MSLKLFQGKKKKKSRYLNVYHISSKKLKNMYCPAVPHTGCAVLSWKGAMILNMHTRAMGLGMFCSGCINNFF